MKFIVIVDESLAVQDVLCTLLRSRDRQVLCYSTPFDALDKLDEWYHTGSPLPTCLLINITFSGMRDMAVIHALRGRPYLRSIPIIAIIAQYPRINIPRALLEGANEAIALPIQPDEIASLMKKYRS